MTDPIPSPQDAGAPPRERRSRWRSWPVAVALTQVALVVALAAWLLDGRAIGVPGAWAWAVKTKAVAWLALVRVIVLGLTITAAGALGYQRIRARCRSDAPVLAVLVLLTFALQLSVAGLSSDATFLLIAATASPISTEYFSVAWETRDVSEFLRQYTVTMAQSRHHVATHPPGAVLFYWACIRIYQSHLFPHALFDKLTAIIVGAPRESIASEASKFPGVSLGPDGVGPALFCCLVLGACGALALVPLYHLARAAARRTTALTVCVLFAISPAPVLFFQGLDSLLLLLAAGAAMLMYLGLRNGCPWWAGVAGLVVGAGFLVSFGAGAVGLVVGLVAVLWALRARPAVERSGWRALATFAAGWVLIALAGHIACGMKLHVIFSQGMAAHREATWIGFQRGYWAWLGLNMVEFGCFLGLPVCVCVIGAAREAIRRGRPALADADLVGLAGAAALIALNLSGSVRGEVGRVWLFMMPPLVLWAAYWLRSAAPGKGGLTVCTAALTLAQLVFLGLALTPVVMPF